MENRVQKKISCAVIGLGAFGKHHIRLLRDNPRAILAGAVSPSADDRTSVMVDTGTKLYTDAKKVLEDPSIEAVIIATPLSTHAKLTTEALGAGKHVFLEKPFASNAEEAQQIKKAVNAAGKIFMLGHQYLYNDDIAALKRELDQQRIGAVRSVYAEQLYPGPIRFDVGCFREAATHEIAVIDHLFSPGAPVSVTANAVDFSGGKREDFAAATLRYQNGLFAHIVISAYSPIKSRRMILTGDLGMALFDDRSQGDKVVFSLRPFPQVEKRHQTKTLPLPEGETFIPKIVERKEPLFRELEHFLDCIETHATPRSDIAHAMRVEEVLDRVSRVMKID